MYPKPQMSSPEFLLETYGDLVKKIANHLLGRLPASVVRDDLIQAGMLGLLEAAKRYDATKGASFETFVSIRIKGAMLDEVRKSDWAPRSVHRNARRVSAAIAKLENCRQEVNDKSIAEELGLTINEYHELLKDIQGCKIFQFSELSQDEDDVNQDTWLRSTVLDPSMQVEEKIFKKKLADCIADLPERERLVLALYYNEELNLKEIGDVLGVSESRVSQIHTQAALKLRVKLSMWS